MLKSDFCRLSLRQTEFNTSGKKLLLCLKKELKNKAGGKQALYPSPTNLPGERAGEVSVTIQLPSASTNNDVLDRLYTLQKPSKSVGLDGCNSV